MRDIPKIPPYSRMDPLPKNEVSYKQWAFQIRGTLMSHLEEAVKSALIGSLCGDAQDLVWFLGLDGMVEEILERMET